MKLGIGNGKPNSEHSKAVGENFLLAIHRRPFGSWTKRETDLILFDSLVEAGLIAKDALSSPARLSRILEMSPGKCRSLVYDWRLQRQDPMQINELLSEQIIIAEVDVSEGKVTLDVEDRFLHDHLESIIRETGTSPELATRGGRLTITVEALASVLTEVYPGTALPKLVESIAGLKYQGGKIKVSTAKKVAQSLNAALSNTDGVNTIASVVGFVAAL